MLLCTVYSVSLLLLQTFLIDVWIVSAISLILMINLYLLKKGYYHSTVLVLLVIVFTGVTVLAYTGGDKSHLKLYTLGFLYLFCLLLSGLVGVKTYYSVLIGLFAILSVTYYFIYLTIPRSPYPLMSIIDAYIGVVVILILSSTTSAILNRQLNKAFSHIMLLNEGLEEKVQERTALLEESREKLVETEKLAALGGLVGGMSHELNTPLGNAITAYSHMSEMTKDIRSKIHKNSLTKTDLNKFLDTAVGATDILNKNLKIATDLLQNFKKTSADIHHRDERDIQLYSDIETIVLSNRSGNMDYKNIEIQISGSEELVVRGNTTILWQVLTNLINNAFFHAFPEKSGLIIISYKPENKGILISVEDKGIGMDEEIRKKIYDPFFTTRRGQGGTGLGLNIVYNIIHKANGTINCESTMGKGTVFSIWLPWEITKT